MRLRAASRTGADNGIRLTALVVVGDVLAGPHDRSRLYDPTFTTLFRKASHAVPAQGGTPGDAGVADDDN